MDRPLAGDAGSGAAEQLLDHPRMIELIAARRRFFGYAWTVFLTAAVLFFGTAAFFPAALGFPLVPGLSVGLVVGVVYLALIFVLTVQFARKSRAWDEIVGELRTSAGYDLPATGGGTR